MVFSTIQRFTSALRLMLICIKKTNSVKSSKYMFILRKVVCPVSLAASDKMRCDWNTNRRLVLEGLELCGYQLAMFPFSQVYQIRTIFSCFHSTHFFILHFSLTKCHFASRDYFGFRNLIAKIPKTTLT